MADIRFKCPRCREPIEAPADLIGEITDCPHCQQRIEIPESGQFVIPEPAPPMPDVQKYKKCPFCTEQILSDAIKCKHCGEFLEQQSQNQISTGESPGKNVQTVEQTSKRWKAQQLMAALLCIVSVIAFAVSSSDPASGSGGWGFFGLVTGIFWFIITRIRAWWHHG